MIVDREWAGAADCDLRGRGVINNHVGASGAYNDIRFVNIDGVKGNRLTVDHSGFSTLNINGADGGKRCQPASDVMTV